MRLDQVRLLSVMVIPVILAGCSSKPDIDTDKLTGIAGSFISAMAEGDQNKIQEYAKNYDYEKETVIVRNRSSETYEVLRHAISLASVTDCEEPVYDSESRSVKAEITFSYIDLSDFCDSLDTEYLKKDELISALDNYGKRKEIGLDVRYVYIEDIKSYKISSSSAHKIYDLITKEMNALPVPVMISEQEGEDMFAARLNEIAQGELGSLPDQFYNDNGFRPYDNLVVRGTGYKTKKAVGDFLAAYMSYVMSHDYRITETEPYHFEFKGNAPSSAELSQSLMTDEFLTQYYMNYIRYTHLGWDLSRMWDDQSALIYSTLARAIPGCSSEDYGLSASVLYMPEDYGQDVIPPLSIKGNYINEPVTTIFTIEHGLSWERVSKLNEAAIKQLYENGEMGESMYNYMMENLTPENYGFTTDDQQSASGYPNQAVGTYEHVPEWCDDGSIVYGYSNPDDNGYWMFYSKAPDVLDTVAYYIDNSGIRLTCYFADHYPEGTKFYIDWWIDGEQVRDDDIVTIGTGGSNEIDALLPTAGMPGPGKYEMRVWENADNRHVLAYVTIYR